MVGCESLQSGSAQAQVNPADVIPVDRAIRDAVGIVRSGLSHPASSSKSVGKTRSHGISSDVRSNSSCRHCPPATSRVVPTNEVSNGPEGMKMPGNNLSDTKRPVGAKTDIRISPTSITPTVSSGPRMTKSGVSISPGPSPLRPNTPVGTSSFPEQWMPDRETGPGIRLSSQIKHLETDVLAVIRAGLRQLCVPSSTLRM